MPSLEELVVFKKERKPKNKSGRVDVGVKQISEGDELRRDIENVIEETGRQQGSAKRVDVHSRRILPSEKLTTHFDVQHPLPTREVLVHQNDLEEYKEEAFEKHTLDLTEVRKNIEAMKDKATSEALHTEVSGELTDKIEKFRSNPDERKKNVDPEKLAELEREENEMINKIASIDTMGNQEVFDERNQLVVSAETLKATVPEGNDSGFGRREKRSKKPVRDPWMEDREAYDSIVTDSNAKKSRRDYDPEIGAIIKNLDKLTDSEYVLDHREAAELLKNLSGEQARKVTEKASPALMNKFENIDEPEFGRKERRHKEHVYDPWRRDAEAYDQIVADSKQKKAPRGQEVKPVKELEVEEISVVSAQEEEKASVVSEAQKLEENYLTPEQAKEIDAIADEIRKRKLSEVVSAPTFFGGYVKGKSENNNPDNLTIEELRKIRRNYDGDIPSKESKDGSGKKIDFFRQKARTILNNSELQLQLLKAAISIPASVLGYKSLYDVPAYLEQRYAVRGNIMGIGKGKGLSGSVEELLNVNNQSDNRRKNKDYKEGSNPRSFEDSAVIKAIKDLDKRLAKTREGEMTQSKRLEVMREGRENTELRKSLEAQGRSEEDIKKILAEKREGKKKSQRDLIAKILWENRHQERQTREERQKELENILDNYTTTKVTGIQAAREALNTACVATGSFALQGLAYGGLAFFEKHESMRREEKVKALEKGPEAEAEEVNAAKVFVRGLKETYEGLKGLKDLKDLKGLSKKDKLQKGLKIGLGAVKSFGSISRFVGIAIGMGTGGHVYGASLDKLIDTLESKDKFAAIGGNFSNNADRLLKIIPSVGAVLADSLGHSNAGVVDSLSHQEIPTNDVPYKPSVRLDFTDNLAHVKSMTGEEIPEVSFQGGKSVWQEGNKQLLARFGEKFANLDETAKNLNIARLQNAIVANPEAFGLPANINFNRMELADLEKIRWNDAFNNVFENREGLTEVVHNLDKTLAHPDEKLVRFNGSIGSSGLDLEPGTADMATKYFDNEGMKARLAELSEKARKFYDPATSQTEKRKIFEELAEARENMDRATGGKSSFGLDGDINLKLANGETINIFDNPGAPLVDLAKGFSPAEDSSAPEEIASGPRHRPSLGYDPLDPHHENSIDHSRYVLLDGKKFDMHDHDYAEKISRHMELKFNKFAKGHDFEEKVKFLSEQGKKYFDENIPQEEKDKALEAVNNLRRMVEKEYHYSVDVFEGGDVQFSPMVGDGIRFSAEQIDKGIFPDVAVENEIHHPSLGYQAPVEHLDKDSAVNEIANHQAAEDLPDISNPREMRGSITDAGVAEALLHNAENQGDGERISLDLRHVKEISPEALKVWQNKPGVYNFHGLQKIDRGTHEILSNYKGKVMLNDVALRQFEDFDKKNAAGTDWFAHRRHLNNKDALDDANNTLASLDR